MKPPGHDSPRTPNVHMRGRKNEKCGGREKKREILGPPYPSWPHPPKPHHHRKPEPKMDWRKLVKSGWPKRDWPSWSLPRRRVVSTTHTTQQHTTHNHTKQQQHQQHNTTQFWLKPIWLNLLLLKHGVDYFAVRIWWLLRCFTTFCVLVKRCRCPAKDGVGSRRLASHQGSTSAVEQVTHPEPSIFQATSEGPSRITVTPPPVAEALFRRKLCRLPGNEC